jgi:hypothetical protein
VHASRYKFGIRALLLLTAITALAAWDLRRQEAFERAIARFDEVKGTHLQTYAHDVERVNFQGCNLEPDAIEELSQRVEIRELDLSESNVDPAMLVPLIKLQKLEKLNLSNCSKIDDRIAPLIHALPALVRLDRHNPRLSVDVSKQIQQQLNATARKQRP